MKLRRWFQTGSLFGLSLGPLFEAKWLCLPILNCHSCPIASFSCPIGILSHYISLGIFPILLLGTLLAFGALVGRAFCGWVCPFGFLQELLHKIPSPKFELWPPLRYGRYLILIFLVLMVPALWGLENPFFFCRLCPAAALEVSIPYALMEGGFPSFWGTVIRLSLTVVVLLLAVFSLRIFCRMFCPVGAITSLFNPFSAFTLRQNHSACVQCGECTHACPVGVNLQEEAEGINYRAPLDCILCLDCTHACPMAGGLKGSFAGMVRENRS